MVGGWRGWCTDTPCWHVSCIGASIGIGLVCAILSIIFDWIEPLKIITAWGQLVLYLLTIRPVYTMTWCKSLSSIYRVSGLSCPEAGGCKSAILWGFPDVFSLFGPFKVGAISFRYSWTTGMKKKFRNLVLKKGQISGFAQIDIFLISNFFGYLSITFFKTIQM